MPLADLTMPSTRSVPTCRPALPGGKFFASASCACLRPISDSNGSRRAIFGSGSIFLSAETGFATVTAEFAGFFAGFAAIDFAEAGFAEPGFAEADAVVAGVATFTAGTTGATAFLAAALAGAVCARIPGAANRVIPTSKVIKGRIICSFPLNVLLPAWQHP